QNLAELTGRAERLQEQILNHCRGPLGPPVVFVRPDFVTPRAIADAAVLQRFRRRDASDEQHGAIRPGSRNCGRAINRVVVDRTSSHAGGSDDAERAGHADDTRTEFHLPDPPGWRSSDRIPRIKLAGLLRSVSVNPFTFSVEIRIFSSSSSMLSEFWSRARFRWSRRTVDFDRVSRRLTTVVRTSVR